MAAQNAAVADDTTGIPVRSLERLRHLEDAQAAARDQNSLGFVRMLNRAVAERDDISLALLARTAEFKQVEALQREHIDISRGQKLLQALFDDVAVSGGDPHALGADIAQAIDDGLAHRAHRQAGPLP